MSNPKSWLLAVIPVDILLTKLSWKWFSPACWSWLPRISTSCPHSFNASLLVAGLPLLFWLGPQGVPPQLPQGFTYYPASGALVILPLPVFALLWCLLTPNPPPWLENCVPRVSWCMWGLLLAKAEVGLVTELSGRGRRLLQSIRTSCSLSQGKCKLVDIVGFYLISSIKMLQDILRWWAP